METLSITYPCDEYRTRVEADRVEFTVIREGRAVVRVTVENLVEQPAAAPQGEE